MASGNFEKCKSLTAVSEGGWSDHPSDPGGATMKGVTLRTYAAWRKLHGQPEPTKADLKVISDDEVSAIFKAQYWDAARCDLRKIPSTVRWRQDEGEAPTVAVA